MKRCPECEFIYEDDQHCCDMDGAELAFASVPGLATDPFTEEVTRPSRIRWRGLTLLGLTGILGTVLFADHYNLSHQGAPVSATAALPTPIRETPTPTREPSPQESNPAVSPSTPAETASPSPSPAAKPQASDVKADKPVSRTAELASNRPRSVELRREAAAPRTERRLRPEPENRSKQSKFGSFLKKTGQVLKKPFRL